MGGLGRRPRGWRCARRAGASARQAAAHRRLLQRRRAGDEVRARCARRIERLPRPDRLILISPMIGITALRALRRAGRACRRCCPPSPRRRGSASCRSSIRSSTTPSRSTARASRIALTVALQDRIAAAEPRRPARAAAADPHLPVGGRLHGQHAGGDLRPLCPAAGERQRARAVRSQSRRRGRARCCATPPRRVLSRILPAPPRRYRTVIITNAGRGSIRRCVERVTEAGDDRRASRDRSASPSRRASSRCRMSRCRSR